MSLRASRAALLLSLLLLPTFAWAQSRSESQLQKKGTSSFGPLVAVNFPDGGDVGWGVAAQYTNGRGFLTAVAEAGYDDIGSLDIFHGALGARVTVGPVYVGGLAGYWSEVEDFDVVPMVGLHLWKIDVGARYKGLFGDGDWFAVTGAIHFGKW